MHKQYELLNAYLNNIQNIENIIVVNIFPGCNVPLKLFWTFSDISNFSNDPSSSFDSS